jgi:hypothetical protein
MTARVIGYRMFRGNNSHAEAAVIDEGGNEFIEKLNTCNDIRNHSPDGFEWGYGGSGPAQLALALCVDALRREGKPWPVQRAQRIYQHLKADVIASHHEEQWRLSWYDVTQYVERMEAGLGPLELATCDIHSDEKFPFSEFCPKCLAAEQATCPHCGETRDSAPQYENCKNFHC